MKKSILNLGKALNKAEQKTINGGAMAGYCSNNCNCSSNQVCKEIPCDGEMTLMCVS